MKNFAIYIVFCLLIIGCNSPNSGISKYEIDCPKLDTLSSYGMYDIYSIKTPTNWKSTTCDPIDTTEISTHFFADSTQDQSIDGKFIRFHFLGITHYKGNYNVLKQEHYFSLQNLLNENPDLKLIESGRTNILKYEATYAEIEEENEWGTRRSIMFLIPYYKNEYEYFILNSSFIGTYDADFELCQMIQILKSFEIK